MGARTGSVIEIPEKNCHGGTVSYKSLVMSNTSDRKTT